MPTKATMVTIFYLSLLALTPHIINAVSSNQSLQRMRNQYLRIYLSYKKDRIKEYLFASKDILKDKATNIYHSVLSKYYDANAFYYGLSPEDRELIDQIINLHF